jgi:hypothetical protein
MAVADSEKKPVSLASVIEKGTKQLEEFEKEHKDIDPFSLTAPRPGDVAENQSEGELTGETPTPELGTKDSADGPEPVVATASTPEPVITDKAPDIWADVDDIEYEDSDTGEKFVVRAPKSYADKVRNGYSRRSVMDRATRYLAQAKSSLEPIITDGRFAQIQPMLDRALQDPEFGQFVNDAYNRRVQGLPLTAQQQQAVTQVQQQQAQQAMDSGLGSQDIEDPYVAEIVRQIEMRISNQMQPFQQELENNRRFAEQQQAQQRMAQQQQVEAARVIQELENEFRSVYPSEFQGSSDDVRAKIRHLFNYAGQAGYITQYDNANNVKLAVRLAHTQLASTSAPSPLAAAQSAASIEAQARQEAAQRVAASSGGGRGVVERAQPSVEERMRKIPRKKADGSPRNIKDLAADVSKLMG